ncbi:hypothetical protein DPMN_091020 [Dreissena polymorpha]|uniref:Uncharacterized protein n=1 Tax=Dreissena polymorpha TaxID=45954 RepID=A0A9D4R0B2_DREPO|nr:hypothetical protein DPMN_091020 [Dreissena polymorpha]
MRLHRFINRNTRDNVVSSMCPHRNSLLVLARAKTLYHMMVESPVSPLFRLHGGHSRWAEVAFVRSLTTRGAVISSGRTVNIVTLHWLIWIDAREFKQRDLLRATVYAVC